MPHRRLSPSLSSSVSFGSEITMPTNHAGAAVNTFSCRLIELGMAGKWLKSCRLKGPITDTLPNDTLNFKLSVCFKLSTTKLSRL